MEINIESSFEAGIFYGQRRGMARLRGGRSGLCVRSRGDRLLYNTDTIHLEIERIQLAENFELSVALRGEVFFALLAFGDHFESPIARY